MAFASHAKSAVKALTWRAAAGVDTMVVGYLITGHLSSALGIVTLELFTKSFLYYLHERAWCLEPSKLPAKVKLVFAKKEMSSWASTGS